MPQFGHKEKISVIQADAIEYIQALPDGKFDYCFADIWTGNMDWQPYIALKMMCSKFNQMKITYWIEDAIGASMMDVIKHLILQASLKHIIKNPDDSIYDFDSMTLAFFKDLLKNVEITNKEQVDFYMDYKNIIDMIGNNERKNK